MPQSSPVRDALSWARSLLFYDPLIYVYTVVLGTLSLLSSLLDRGGRVQHGFARLWSRMILATIGASVKVTGLENINPSGPHVYIVNHLSAMDIPVLYSRLPFQFRILAKKELFRYPFLGWHLRRSGQIPVERESALASLRSLNVAARTLRDGMPLVIFPEGGRSADGQVQPFMSGAFYVAVKAGAEIVPMALVGTYELLPMNSFHIRPRPLELAVGDPISTAGADLRKLDPLIERTRQAVEDLYYARAKVPDPRKNRVIG